MDFNKIKLEHILFGTAILLAGLVRFLNLGAAPLNETEARLALDARQIAQGATEIGIFNPAPYPLYILVTSLLFSLFESTNFLARLLPALAGMGLLLVPILLRNRVEKPAALLLTFGLAIDPGLVAASRLASGPMLALVFGLLILIAWQQNHPRWAGFLGALFLLSGPPAFQGILIALVTGGLLWLFMRPVKIFDLQDYFQDRGSKDSRQAVIALFISLFVIGTLFLQVPQGISALANSLLTYFKGWTSLPEIPAGRVIAALAIYQPVAVIFALVSIGKILYRRRVDSLDLLLIFGAGISLLHGLIYSGRQALDLVWVLVPTWLLAARELARLLDLRQPQLAVYGQALLIVLLAGLMWFNLAGLGRSPLQMNSSLARLLLMAGVILLIAITTILVSMGWSWQNGKHGLVLGILGAGSLYLISAFWSSSQVGANLPSELWYPSSAGNQTALFEKSVRDISVWKTGFPNRIDITLIGDSTSIQWALRNFEQVHITDTIPSQELPAIIITPQSEQPPALTAAYRGQDFIWWTYPGWESSLPGNLAGWFTFREAPLIQDQIILWVRSDLFPGGEVSIPSSNQP